MTLWKKLRLMRIASICLLLCFIWGCIPQRNCEVELELRPDTLSHPDCDQACEDALVLIARSLVYKSATVTQRDKETLICDVRIMDLSVFL